MKKITFIIFTQFSLFSFGQINLVPNPSFEQHDTCPYAFSQIHFAVPWFAGFATGGGSSDYFNQCNGNTSSANVPANVVGYQNARTGIGYAGIGLGWGGNIREYIEVKLNLPLTAGKRYYAGFHVSLADKMKFAVDGVGAYFSIDTVPPVPGWQPMPYTPQVENTIGNIITDTANWVLVSGFFTATGGEQFMTIGNFKYDSLTSVDTVSGNQGYAYYYIDDVTVMDSLDVGVNELQENISINIFPNPCDGKFAVQSETKENKIEVYNVFGEKIYRSEINKQKTEVDISSQPSGIYFVKVKTSKRMITKKILLLK